MRNEPGFVLVVDPNAWFQNNELPVDSPEGRRARLEEVLAKRFPEEWADRTPPSVDAARAEMRTRSRAGRSRVATVDLVPWISPDQERELRLHALPGVGFHPTTRRRALDGDHASALIGHVSRFGVGLEGLEYRWNETLSGVPRMVRRKSDLRGVVPGSEEELRPGVPGKDLVLTIDSTLQHEVELELASAVARHKAEAATAVVLDAASGEILAMAGCPTYDVNDAGKAAPEQRRIAGAQWVYEPGSTMKAITLAGALETGVVRPSSTFQCGQTLVIGKRKVRCDPHGAFQHGHGIQDVQGVLTHSCNVSTARVALGMGADKMRRTLDAFGFGRTTGSGLPGEESGMVSADWSRIRTATVGFGQGVSTTPIQMAAAYGAFVDGVYRSPRIVRGVRDPRTGRVEPVHGKVEERIISSATAATIRAMLANVVVNGTGTPAALDRYLVGGKTGTAQIPGKGGYLKGQFHASFVGLAPIRNPRFVILVTLRKPKGVHYGGAVAGPVFKRIAERALTLADVAPERAEKPKSAQVGSAAE